MKGITDSRHYADIADAIRAKNGTKAAYYPSEMASAIRAIQGTGEGNAEDYKKVSEVQIFDQAGMFYITYEDGSVVTGSATFDENGLPTSLTDDNGNSVNFTSGYPTSATNGGNIVPIIWG